MEQKKQWKKLLKKKLIAAHASTRRGAAEGPRQLSGGAAMIINEQHSLRSSNTASAGPLVGVVVFETSWSSDAPGWNSASVFKISRPPPAVSQPCFLFASRISVKRPSGTTLHEIAACCGSSAVLPALVWRNCNASSTLHRFFLHIQKLQIATSEGLSFHHIPIS